METKFKDVAHLYIGCKVQWKNDQSKCYSVSYFTLSDARYYLTKPEVKPILYPLSAMTEEQKKHIGLLYYESKIEIYLTPFQLMYLLSQHFDIFGLIESNQAIDVTTLNK